MEVKWHMHAFEIGEVKRVDFSPIGKTPGFKLPEKFVSYKMAFVHFERFYDSANAKLFMSTLTEGSSYTMQFEKYYWLVLPAKHIVPETTMNIHQVVENCRFLEKKVEEQSALIEKQSALIEQLMWKDNKSEWNSTTGWNDKTTDLCYEWKDPDEDIKMAADDTFEYPFFEMPDDTFEYPFFEMGGQAEEYSVSDTSSDMPSLVDLEEREYIEGQKIVLRQKFTEDFCGNN